MKEYKVLIDIAMITIGVVLGLYVGVWLCFIGGIIDVITEVRTDDLSAINVAVGVVKVMFATFAGWLFALVFIIPGYAALE